ncbi:hypothetical protein [Microbacterium elymi]|uniref:Uncharacterized protein n=1 Tax=Microbacterium elymi TaxID=2909587 RepID=A0ABY5NH38_9MICO|nr:hypothetical protein [Microbacterium elymi]UUT34436.1 hypothetical protein L2X98_27975 [Microbacterium elymi]
MRILVEASEQLSPGEDLLRRTTWRLESGIAPPPDDLVRAARLALTAFDPARAARLAEAAIDAGAADAAQARVVWAIACNQQVRFAEAARLLAVAERDVLRTGSPALRREWLDASVVALHQGLGRTADAEHLLERVEAATSARPADRRLARALRANILADDGRLAETVDLTRAVLGDDAPPDYAAVVAASSLGEAQATMGLTHSARQTHRMLYALKDAGVPEAQRAGDYAALQELMCQMLEGRVDEASVVAEGVYRMLVAGHEHTTVGLAALVAGRCRLGQGRIAEAAQTMREAVDLLAPHRSGRRAALGAEHPRPDRGACAATWAPRRRRWTRAAFSTAHRCPPARGST